MVTESSLHVDRVRWPCQDLNLRPHERLRDSEKRVWEAARRNIIHYSTMISIKSQLIAARAQETRLLTVAIVAGATATEREQNSYTIGDRLARLRRDCYDRTWQPGDHTSVTGYVVSRGSEKVRSADRRLSEDKGDCTSKRPSIIAVREPQVQ